MAGKRKRSSTPSSSRKRTARSNRSAADRDDNDDNEYNDDASFVSNDESQQEEDEQQQTTPSNKRRRKEVEEEEEAVGSPTFLSRDQVRLGMELEICDKDDIWSSARIVDVVKKDDGSSNSRNKKKKSGQNSVEAVTVRYDGWGSEWDETIKLENNRRLVKIGTFTKRLKCMVDLLPRRGAKRHSARYSNLWPCIVNIRSPNPFVDHEDYDLAEEFLREEPNVFIQPYGAKEKFLADNVLSTLTVDANQNGLMQGRWIHVARLRMWRNDISSIEGELAPNFERAYKLAVKDTGLDILPYAAFEKGSLVSSRLRRKPQKKLYTTDEEDDANQSIESKQKSDENTEDEIESSSTTSSSSTEESLKNDISDDSKSDTEITLNPNFDSHVIYHPPAVLPRPLTITTSIYPDSQILKSTKTGNWIATYRKNGNDIFLGSYSTQFEAHSVIQSAKNKKKNRQTLIDSYYAKRKDVKNLTLSAAVTLLASRQQQQREGDGNNNSHYNNSNSNNTFSENQKNSSFSLHEWTVQHTKHKGYELEKFRAKFEELKKIRELRALERVKQGRSKRKRLTS